MKSIHKLDFTYNQLLVFISLLFIASPIKNVNADVSGVSAISSTDMEKALNLNSVKFHEYENTNNLFDDFFGKNNEPNETEFKINFQDLSLQIDSKNLREIYKQKLLEMSTNERVSSDKNNWTFFNSKI